MPASERELKFVSILFYQTFGEELPNRDYRKQDIEYILQQINLKQSEGIDGLDSTILH